MNTSTLLSTKLKEVFGTQSSEVRSDARKSPSGVSSLKEDSNANKIIICGKFTDKIPEDRGNETTRRESFTTHEGSTLEEVSHKVNTTTDRVFTGEITKDMGSKEIRHEKFTE